MNDLPDETPPWADLVLVCRKCSTKLDARGFGPDGDLTLQEALKAHIRARGLKGIVRAVETGCLDLCPDKLVSVMRIATPGAIVTVPPGTPPDQVLRRLGLRTEAADPVAGPAAAP